MFLTTDQIEKIAEILNSPAGPITLTFALLVFLIPLISWIIYERFFNKTMKNLLNE